MAPRGAPGVSQGRPETKKCRKLTSRPPPLGPVGRPNSDFLSILAVFFPIVFVDCRFGRFPGRILSGFGEVFGEIFEYLFVNCRCEAEAAKSHSTLLFTVV